MQTGIQLVLGIFCVCWSQTGIPQVNGLPPPWKFMVPMLAPPPPPGSAAAASPGASGSAAAPASPTAGFASPFPFGYPGLWSPFLGMPPPLSYLPSDYTFPASNETDAAIAAYLAAKAEEKKAKASKKLLKETAAAAAAAGTTVPEITQLAALLTKLLQTTTTTASPPSEENGDENDDGATIPGVVVGKLDPTETTTTAASNLAKILKGLLQ